MQKSLSFHAKHCSPVVIRHLLLYPCAHYVSTVCVCVCARKVTSCERALSALSALFPPVHYFHLGKDNWDNMPNMMTQFVSYGLN